jgi:hypothetical protein
VRPAEGNSGLNVPSRLPKLPQKWENYFRKPLPILRLRVLKNLPYCTEGGFGL